MPVPSWLRDAVQSRYDAVAWRDYSEFYDWLESVLADGVIESEDLKDLASRYPDPRPSAPTPIEDEDGVESYLRDPPDPGPLASLKERGWIDEQQAQALRLPVMELKRLLGLTDEDVISDIQENALHIVGRSNNPVAWGENRTGLVYGMVQSGKTASMLTVMAVARRAGYRLFIILAGDKESLRVQTQSRVNKAFQLENGVNRQSRIHSPTWQEDFRNLRGDYLAHFRYADRSRDAGSEPSWTTIIVVKKNTYHLQGLVASLVMLQSHMERDGKDFASAFPCIVLDDESDYASQNTDVFGVGNTIHNDIVALRRSVPLNTYIGYTATPQACLSADPNNPVGYPKDFFWLLEPFMEEHDGVFRPRSYLGAWEVFREFDPWVIRRVGRDEWPHYEKDRRGKSRGIYVPPLPGSRSGDFSDARRIELDGEFLADILAGRRPAPPSFVDALMDFQIAAGMLWWRHWRRSGEAELPSRELIERCYPYVAAMVHLSETQENQGKVRELVQRLWAQAVVQLRGFDAKTSPADHPFRLRWNAQLERSRELTRGPAPTFSDVAWFMHRCVEIVEQPINNPYEAPYRPYPGSPFVYLLNSGGDGMELFYDENAAPEIKTKRAGIFVGGNILSRGLTIEGLAVTVFGRASQMPLGDATLQMGRWFGHKQSMIDLVSLYLQAEIQEVMAQVAEADRYLRLQIKDAILHGHSPTEVLLEMRNSPFFRITSPAKSAFLQKDQAGLGFSGRSALLNEPSFDSGDILHNLRALKAFEEKHRGRPAHSRAMLYERVPPRAVITLLRSMKCPDDASQVTFGQYADYLEDWLNGNGLPPFPSLNVAVMNGVPKRQRKCRSSRPSTEGEARADALTQFGPIVGGVASDGDYKGDPFLDYPVEWHRAHDAPSKERAAGEPILVAFYRLHPNYVTRKLYDKATGKSRTQEVYLQPGDRLHVALPGYSDNDLAVTAFAAWTPAGGPMYSISTNRLIDVTKVKQRGREQMGSEKDAQD